MLDSNCLSILQVDNHKYTLTTPNADAVAMPTAAICLNWVGGRKLAVFWCILWRLDSGSNGWTHVSSWLTNRWKTSTGFAWKLAKISREIWTLFCIWTLSTFWVHILYPNFSCLGRHSKQHKPVLKLAPMCLLYVKQLCAYYSISWNKFSPLDHL